MSEKLVFSSPFLPCIHINERQYLAQIWNEALDFVREHESRITFSQKEFNGEFIEIVSWNDPTSKNLASLTFSDSWKGSALPNSSNDLKTTPQNCVALKIRDFYQNSNQINSKPKQEKLLHEIMGQVNLILSHKFKNSADKIWPLHYGFEENAAYLRFNSTEDACHFYNCINAQWYNGNLLTPKFVTDSKYFKRFPSAKKSIFTRI